MFIDSHCHIDFPELAERNAAILANMQANDVSHAMCISVNLENFPRVLAMAEAHDNIFASVGVHPDYEDVTEPSVAQLVELAKHPKVIAIGETGLDYYRLGDKTVADMDWQRERFRVHIRAARVSGKPLIIHTRNASEDTLKIMQEEGADQIGGVMHCFTESLAVAQAALAMNFYISMSGIVTFKSAKDLQAVAKEIPLDRLLIETDAPYLAPIPHRGKTNEPAWVRHVGEFLADLRGEPLTTLAQATTNNFIRLFPASQLG
ncbi:TatD family hydrolase [Ampullimonas aquatilis]|uniref:TatD family hydrolase n=1 Tax=Ampullimonas aquatilis TaxID=1341549 RepID=UPI003C77B36D